MIGEVIVVRGRRSAGPDVTAVALVSKDGFSPRYDLNRRTGIITRKGHALEGKSIAGVALVCPMAKGGVAAGWALLDLRSRGLAPAALLFDVANSPMVQGAVISDIAILDGFAGVLRIFQSGDLLTICPAAGTVTVSRSARDSDKEENGE